jgi:hypothetical protein
VADRQPGDNRSARGRLAVVIGVVDASAILSSCVAFAGMDAHELASQDDDDRTHVDVLVELASQVDAT